MAIKIYISMSPDIINLYFMVMVVKSVFRLSVVKYLNMTVKIEYSKFVASFRN